MDNSKMQDLVDTVIGEMDDIEAEYALEPSAFDRTGANEVAWFISYRTDASVLNDILG